MVTVMLFTGCAGMALNQERPSIAHVHIGHAMIAWKYAQDKQGLFIVAERAAEKAEKEARLALENKGDLDRLQSHIKTVVDAIESPEGKKDRGRTWRLKRGLSEAAQHIEFAAESDDASENVKAFVAPFRQNVNAVIERCDLIVALAEEVLSTTSPEDAIAFSEEIYSLTTSNRSGVDSDGDGVIGSSPEETGLVQLREQIDSMTAREDPSYHPVAKSFLFGLVRLENGKWTFSWLVPRKPYGY